MQRGSAPHKFHYPLPPALWPSTAGIPLPIALRNVAMCCKSSTAHYPLGGALHRRNRHCPLPTAVWW